MRKPRSIENDSSAALAVIIYKWKFAIAGFVIVLTIAAAVFTAPHFIPPLYKSEAVIYPPSTYSSKVLLNQEIRFGNDKEIDEHIQILKSVLVRDSMIRKFNLAAHYKISINKPAYIHDLYQMYDDKVMVERTRYNSISIRVYDTDPALAALMANDIVKIGDELKSRIIKTNLENTFQSLSDQYNSGLKELDEIVARVKIISPDALTGPEELYSINQTDLLKQRLDVRAGIQKARENQKADLMEILYEYEYKLNQLSLLHSSYDQAYISLNTVLPAAYVISPAEPAYKKEYPKRWLITMFVFICSAVVACCAAFVFEKIKTGRLGMFA
jgi:uncharacterized protein involved in exopolysaccharide biosynthesis